MKDCSGCKPRLYDANYTNIKYWSPGPENLPVVSRSQTLWLRETNLPAGMSAAGVLTADSTPLLSGWLLPLPLSCFWAAPSSFARFSSEQSIVHFSSRAFAGNTYILYNIYNVDELRTEVQLICPEHCEFLVLYSASSNWACQFWFVSPNTTRPNTCVCRGFWRLGLASKLYWFMLYKLN